MKKLLIAALMMAGCNERVATCTISGHATSSDKYGQITYHSLSRCDDGWMRDFTEMQYYVLPIGSQVPYKYYTVNPTPKP